jgi:hypothetical protein
MSYVNMELGMGFAAKWRGFMNIWIIFTKRLWGDNNG